MKDKKETRSAHFRAFIRPSIKEKYRKVCEKKAITMSDGLEKMIEKVLDKEIEL